MILKELYIVSLKNKEVIKKYTFNEFGVNVILGVAKKDSNGVGKTAMIDSLRMVLGEKLPVDFKNKEELIKDEIMLSLRKTNGINKDNFYKKYNVLLEDIFDYKDLVKNNILTETSKNVFIKEDKLFVSNEIILMFLDSYYLEQKR